ncbi:MAG: hypothetical protein HQK77_04295 [Desulfobacterales bacterium]|nr:hypothetical protein [Desulfobacterales bacterium]
MDTKFYLSRFCYRSITVKHEYKACLYWVLFLILSGISFIPSYFRISLSFFRLPQFLLAYFYYTIWVTGVFAFFHCLGKKYIGILLVGIFWFMHGYPHHIAFLDHLNQIALILFVVFWSLCVLSLQFLEQARRFPTKQELHNRVIQICSRCVEFLKQKKNTALIFFFYLIFIATVSLTHREYLAPHYTGTGVGYDGFYEGNYREYILHGDTCYIIQAASYMAGEEMDIIKHNTALTRMMIGYLGKQFYPYFGHYENVVLLPGTVHGVFSGFYRAHLCLDILFWFLSSVFLFFIVNRMYDNTFISFITGFLFASSNMFLNLQGYVENYILGRFVFFAFCFLLTQPVVDNNSLRLTQLHRLGAILGVSSLSWSFPVPDIVFLFFYRLKRIEIWQFIYCVVLGILPAIVIKICIINPLQISTDDQVDNYYKYFIDAFLSNYVLFSHWSVPYLKWVNDVSGFVRDIVCFYLIVFPILSCVGFYYHIKLEKDFRTTVFYVAIVIAQFAKLFSMNMWSADHNYGYLTYAIYPLSAIGLYKGTENLFLITRDRVLKTVIILLVFISMVVLNFHDLLTRKRTFLSMLLYGTNVVYYKHWGDAINDPLYLEKKLEKIREHSQEVREWWKKKEKGKLDYIK